MPQQAIRDYLKSRGLKDEEITYDNGNVMARGKHFLSATPQSDGRTYAETPQLVQAYNNYDTQNQIDQLRTRATQPNAEMTGLQQTIRERINRPAQQFNYNAESDPQYQAALRQAKQNAQTAGNNAMVSLGSRGIGNSSITSDRVAQIGQREMGRVTDTVLPQLMQQAYQRFQGQQQQDNQQTGNMFNLANLYGSQDQQQYARLAQTLGLQQGHNQQQFQNERTSLQDALQQRQANLGAAQSVGQQLGRVLQPKEDWSNLYNQTDAPPNMAQQQIDYGREQGAIQQTAQYAGYYNGQPTMQRIMQEANLRNMTADNARAAAAEARAAGNNELARQFDIWDRTGSAPAGIPGVSPGTPIAGKTKAPETAETYSKYVDSVAVYDDDDKLKNPEAVESAILNSGLDEYEMFKLYKAKGLKWDGPAPEKK